MNAQTINNRVLDLLSNVSCSECLFREICNELETVQERDNLCTIGSIRFGEDL